MGNRVLFITHSVKLPGEMKGLDRHACIAEMLAKAGFDVTLATSRFQHWDKEQRDNVERFESLPYKTVFIDEPGYFKNIDPCRIASQIVFTRNLEKFLDENDGFDIVLCDIPPNRVAAACARHAAEKEIPLIVDLNDLWPEAMKMVFDVPGISDILYAPMRAQAKETYRTADYLVGTSDEYARYPYTSYGIELPHSTIYVGMDLAKFDSDAAANRAAAVKPDGELWVTYAGTVGACYGLDTFIEASGYVACEYPSVRFKIIGDGPDAGKLFQMAADAEAPCDFLGYREHAETAAWLKASDILVNSLRPNAPQSIPSKIADYLAAGKPIVNTGASPELTRLLSNRRCGVSVEAGDAAELAGAIEALLDSPAVCRRMGENGRELAEEEFDRNKTYPEFVELVRRLTSAG